MQTKAQRRQALIDRLSPETKMMIFGSKEEQKAAFMNWLKRPGNLKHFFDSLEADDA